jgi:hypothetical protein
MNIGEKAVIVQKISGKEYYINGKVVSHYGERIVVETSNGHQWAIKPSQLKKG